MPDPMPSGAYDPLTKRVLERIEEEHIKPRPRWVFIAMNLLFWALGALAIIFGALASSAALFELFNRDWRLDFAAHPDTLVFLVQATPIAWVLALALFAALGYRNFRLTKRGYRYPLAYLVLGAVLASIALGIVLFSLGVGEAIEEGVGDYPPFYRPVLTEEREWWTQPSAGLLSGVVTAIAPDLSSFTLRTYDGTLWQVDTRDLRAPDFAALSAGAPLRIVGASATTSPFHACFVFLSRVSAFMKGAPSLPIQISSSSERISDGERSDICKGVRPYRALRALSGQ